MSTPDAAAAASRTTNEQGELVEAELRRQRAVLAHGDFGDLTTDEIDQCLAGGDWPDGFSD